MTNIDEFLAGNCINPITLPVLLLKSDQCNTITRKIVTHCNSQFSISSKNINGLL